MLKVARVVERLRLHQHRLHERAVLVKDGVGGGRGQRPVAHQKQALGAGRLGGLVKKSRLFFNEDLFYVYDNFRELVMQSLEMIYESYAYL